MKLLKRMISVVTVIIFSTTNVIGAAPVWPSSAEIPVPEQITVPPIRIPAEFASVEKTYGDFSPDHPVLIYIQDAHANYDAQISAKNILNYVSQNENIHLAFIEGVTDSLNPNGLRFFPNQKINTDVADALAKKGEVTGLELFLLENPDKMRALGIEDMHLYAQNLKTFRRVLQARPFTEIFFSTVREEVDRISNHLLNRELREFVRRRESYRSTARDLHLFLPILFELSRANLHRDFSDPLHQLDWPQISRVAAIQAHRKQMHAEKLSLELQKLQTDLKGSGLGENTISEFVSLFDESSLQTGSTEKRNIRRVFEDVYGVALKGGFRFQNYPLISEAGRRLILQSELDPEQLAHEIDKLSQEMQEKLTTNEKEKSVLDILDDIFLQEQAITLSLDGDSLKKFRARLNELQPKSIVERLKTLAGLANLPLNRFDELSSAANKLDGFISTIDQFYKGAEDREEVMAQSIFDKLKQSGETRAVLITGGFHSSHIARSLEERGASYMILTPKVSHTDPHRSIYYQSIMEGTEEKSFDRSHILKHPITQTGFDEMALRAGSDLSRPAITYLDTFADLAGPNGYTFDDLTSLNPDNGSFINPSSFSDQTIVSDTNPSIPIGVQLSYGGTYDRTIHVVPITKVQETFIAAQDKPAIQTTRTSNLTPSRLLGKFPVALPPNFALSPTTSGFGSSGTVHNLADLIRKYETASANDVHNVMLDTEVDGEWVRTSMPVPKINKDIASLWVSGQHPKYSDYANNIVNSLGWLSAPEWIRPRISELNAFSETIKQEGFTDVVVFGMGGSGLGVKTLKQIFQNSLKKGYPQLHVYDRTHPDALRALEKKLGPNLEKTLFVISSKSGTSGTIEVVRGSQYFFYGRLRQALEKQLGDEQQAAAIIDRLSKIKQELEEKKIKRSSDGTIDGLAAIPSLPQELYSERINWEGYVSPEKNEIEIDGYLALRLALDLLGKEQIALRTITESNWHAVVDDVKKNFVAITDEGSLLDYFARAYGRKTFLNRADIGGRYSVLSYFGLVPAALMGIDIEKIVAAAEDLAGLTESQREPEENPAVKLGLVLGALWKGGQDKLTFLASKSLGNMLGLWYEQLNNESLGKEDKAFIVNANEQLSENLDVYGQDRAFMRVRLAADQDEAQDKIFDALRERGFPVIDIVLPNKEAVGGLFYSLEIATQQLGQTMQVNPFDQPGVERAKINTQKVLATPRQEGIENKTPEAADQALTLQNFIKTAKKGEYFTMLVYTHQDELEETAWEKIRYLIRDISGKPVMLGVGPIYQHSNGQMYTDEHRANIIMFVQTPNPATDVDIPGEAYTFGKLMLAQAGGNKQAYESERVVTTMDGGRPVEKKITTRIVRIDVDDESKLADLVASLTSLKEQLAKSGSAPQPLAYNRENLTDFETHYSRGQIHYFNIDNAQLQTELQNAAKQNVVARLFQIKLLEDYILARLFNIFAVTGPSALEIVSPDKNLTKLLDTIKDRLLNSASGHSVMLVAAKLLHDAKLKGKPVPITISTGQPPAGRRTKDAIQSAAVANAADLQSHLKSIQQLEGFAVGIDVGGSDVKLAVLAPGWDLPLTKENKWEVEPRHMKNGSEYLESLTLLTKFVVAAANLRQASAEQPALWAKVERVLNEKETPFETLRDLTTEIEALGLPSFSPPQSVGISFPDVIANNEILYGLTSKMKGIRQKYDRQGNDSPAYREEFNREIRPLARLLGERLAVEYSLSMSVPTAITNDGKIGSLWAAAVLEEGGLLNFATGTSLSGGFVDAKGHIADRIYELGYLSVFLSDQNPAHKHATWDIHGVGQQLLSQDTVFNLAIEKQLVVNGKVIDTIPAERAKVLAQIQDILLPANNAPESEKEKVRQIFMRVGEYLADIAIVTYHGAVKDTYNKIVLFGRVVSGEGGNIAVKKARAILSERGISVDLLRASDVAQKKPASPMAQMDPDLLNRVAQAIGTVYLGNAERLNQSGFGSSGIVTKKAPGTEQLTNMEENFYRRLSADLDSAHKPEIKEVDTELKELIKAILSVNKGRLDDLVAASKNELSDISEPTIFREQFLLLLEQGKIRFKVQDLSDKQLIAKTANEFAKQNIVIDHLDERLYPRLHSTRNAMGAISFLSIEKEKDKNTYFAEIHLSKALWDEIEKIVLSLKKKKADASLPAGTKILVRKMIDAGVTASEYRTSFLNQIIIHEAIESLVGAAEQITPHRMAGILEMFFATKLAKSLGVSDINLWYLYNATPTYLRNLDIEYRIYGDPTLGNFYDALWQSARDRNMTQHLSRTEPLVHLRPLLTGSRLVKEAPSTPTAEVPEILNLEKQYHGEGLLLEKKDVVTAVAEWIREKKIGKVYDHLLELLSRGYANSGIVIKVDKGENGVLEKEVFYPRQNAVKSQPGVLFFLTEGVEPRTEKIEMVEIVDENSERRSELETMRYFRKGPVELHITYGFWRQLEKWTEKVKVNNQEELTGKGITLLAQVLVHAYIQNFLPPHMEGFTPHGWAGINTLHFATDEAKKEWLTDIDLFYLDHASETGDIRYFYDLLWQYRMTKDVQGNFIQAVYKRFKAIYENNPELITRGIETERDAVVFYTFLVDHHFATIPIAKRPAAVADELNKQSKSSPALKAALENQKLFFEYQLEGSNERVFVLQGPLPLLLLDGVKEEGKLYLDERLEESNQTRITEIKGEIQKKKEERKKLRDSKESTMDADQVKKFIHEIRQFNQDIDKLTRKLAGIWNKPFADWMVDQAYNLMDAKGKKTIVLAVYGGPGTGKTVGTGILRDALAFTFKDIDKSGLLGGLWVNFFGVDAHLKPGPNFRYHKRDDDTRFTTISRPQIYNRGEILRILEGLDDGQEILTPFDPDAPLMPEGTTYDVKTLKGKRPIFGSHLQILILDLTVYGLDPHIMKYIDKVVPIVFDDESVRLERRLERDARPPDEGSGKGDKPDQVLGDFVEKQLVEGKMYEVPLIEDLAEQGPVDIWVQDTNTIVTITKKQHKMSSGFGAGPRGESNAAAIIQAKAPAAQLIPADISPVLREFPRMRVSPLVSGNGTLNVPAVYAAQFENQAGFGISLAVAAFADDHVDIRFDRGLTEFMLKALGVKRDPAGDRFAEAAAETGSQIRRDAARLVDRRQTSPTLLALLPNALGQDETLLYNKLAALDEGTMVILLGRHPALEKAFSQVKRNHPSKRLQFRMVAPKDFGVVDGLTGPINVGKLYGKLLSLASEFNIPEASIGFLFDDENQLANQDKLRQFGLAIKMIGRELDRYIGGSAAAIEEISEALKLNYQLGDKASVVYNSFIQMQHGQPFHVFVMEKLAELRTQQLAEKMASAAA